MQTHLPALLDRLEAAQGVLSLPSADPWRLVLSESLSYLADAPTRAAALEALERTVGLAPDALAAADDATLLAVADPGFLPAAFPEQIRRCAQLALEFHGGDLTADLGRLSPKAVRAALRAFPAIGAPEAVKILLLCGLSTEFTVESNGLRVLSRLGYGAAMPDYARVLRSAVVAADRELPLDGPLRARAHLLLHRHGQTHCKRTGPRCRACPLAARCPGSKPG